MYTTTSLPSFFFFFFFNDTATTEIYTLSLHDALPIYGVVMPFAMRRLARARADDVRDHLALGRALDAKIAGFEVESEEHTSELQSLTNLVCRLLLVKKKKCIILCFGKTLITVHVKTQY